MILTVNNYFHLRVGSSDCACAIYIQWRKVCKVLLWTPRCVLKNSHTHRKPKHSTILYFLNQVRWEITFPNDFTSHYTGACSGKKKCSGIKRVYSYSCSGIQVLTNTHTHILVKTWNSLHMTFHQKVTTLFSKGREEKIWANL